MRQKKAQDATQQLNFNVNGNQYRYEQTDQYQQNYQILKNSQRQSDFSQQQNETYRLQNNQSYYKNEGQISMHSSSQFSQPFAIDQQLTIQKPATIQGRKIDSQQQVQVSFRQSLNHQPNMFFQNQQVTMQFNPIQQREKGFQNSQICQGQIQNQIFQTSSNSQQSGSSNCSTIQMKKKYTHTKEDQSYQGPINQIINIEIQQQPNSQKKKRPTSSLNQNQLKTIYEDIKKTTRKPRSASNTPQKDRSYREKSSRSASKKKQEERSQKKLSQTQEIKASNKINYENQENQLNKNENCSDKNLLQGSSTRRKKKTSNSVHIKPVSKLNEPLQPQQHSNSKSKSPGKVSKNSLHQGVQHNIGSGKVLGEKNFNSPQKSGKAVNTTKSPEDKQKKKKKTSLSKSKSKPRLNHAKSTSQLLVSQYQQSHSQSIQNDIPKHQSTSTQNLKEIDTFIKKNAQKIQCNTYIYFKGGKQIHIIKYLQNKVEQFQKKQEEIEEKLKSKQEEEKRKIQNEQIRKENLVKFCKLKKANENIQNQPNIHLTALQLQQKYAWGTNQQRIKMHQIIQSQLFSQQQQYQQQSHQQSIERNQFNNTYAFQKGQFNNSEEDLQNQLIEKEKKRRQQSGLSFLNNYDEQIIKKKLEQKLVAPLNHEEIKKFMILKKRRLENENKKRQEQQKERQERLKNNLHILDQEIKNQRQNNSCQVQLQQEKEKHFTNTNNQNHQRSKSSQRKKKNRTVSTPNLERFFNKTQNQNNFAINNHENFLQKDLSHKQLIINYNENYIPNSSVQEYEEEMFLQNNYFSNTQQQYAKKYDQNMLQNHQISSNNNAGNSTDINEENFDLLNMEFKKMFNLSGNNDNKLMEFSQSINKTYQLTTQGQSNNASNKLVGSSGKKGKSKQIDFIKPKSISMHASSSVGNLKLAQGFDSSHFGNIQNVNPQFMKIKENSKEKIPKKTRKSQATSISPEPKILTKSSSTVFKNIPQQSGFENNKKQPLYQKIEGQDQVALKDKYIQELINSKKDELKNMYNQINARMNLIKHNTNGYEQQSKASNQHEMNIEDKDDQEIYEQKYFNQPLNNKKIQQAILQQQHVNSNSLGSVNSSQRRVHISNASPIKEEPEEEDKGHFSNLPHPQNNTKAQTNYVNSFQQIFQNNKKDFIVTDSSNLTNNNYPHAINSNPNESDSLRNNQNLKDFQQGNFKKQNLKDSNSIHSNPSSQQSNLMISPIQQGSLNLPFNQIQNNSKASIHSQSKATPSKSISGISAIESKKDLQNKQVNELNINITAPVNTQQQLNGPIQQNVSEQQISQIHSRNDSQIIPADPNAPVSLNLKETIQSKSYISTKNDCKFSQVNQIPQQDADQQFSDIENGMLSSKDLQMQQNDDMPILPLNINLQHRVQQMKKRTHNTDNEESQDSTLRNKAAAPFGQDTTNQVIQKNAQKDRNQNGIQVAITSKTPQSSNREENNSRSQYQNLQKDYTQFEQQEDIKLELIKEVETQNQMSSSNFESQVFQKNFNNTNPSLQPNNNQKAPQQTPRENIQQNSNQSDEAEEIDVDYLFDLDYDQLQELKMIIFQSDPENPEIQALSEQLILYDAAATIIQKVFRGYYTRKCIAAIIEYQRQQDEEEELLYQQAEKFLEENQIEPEELLEGNPIPLMLQQQQQNVPYYSSDQLKEYENREIQFNKNDNSQSQQQQALNKNSNNFISENEFPIKINDYQSSNNKEENTFNRESQGNHPFFTSLSMPEQSINNDLYHQKNYNDDLLQPKQSDFMPDFDFYDKTEKSQQNSAENQKSNSGINNISDSNALHPFVQQPLQNQNSNIESGKQNNNNSNNNNSQNSSNQVQKNKFIDGINNQNYRDQSFNQLNMKEINDQSKSLVTVKEFDTSSKDNYKGVDSVVSQNNQDVGKNIFSPNNQSHLQMEISKLQEQAKMWNQMINQIVQLPENQSQQFKSDALKILNDLQKQSEMSKQILIENIKLNQQIQKSPNISTDRFPLSEIDNMNDKLNCSNLKSGEISQANDKEMTINDKSIQNKQSSQNYQIIQNSQKQGQSMMDDKKTQNQSGQTSKKTLQLDIEEIESNYNLQQRGQKIEKDQKSNDSKVNDQQQGRKNSENDTISQEQRAMVRALSVSSVESNELRYVNIVANNSLGFSNKITKAKQNFIDRLNSDHILNSNSNRNSHNGNESVSSVGSSFFDKQPFKEFTSKILQKYTMPQESVEELIKTREEAIEQKHKTQMDLIHKMHERNRISPKSFERKQFELEKWVSKERENLKVVKKEIERGWEQFAQTIKQTKRDLEFLEQTKRIDTSKLLQSSEEDQLRRLLSMRSESEHSIEEIGFAERRSIDGVYSFKNHQPEDPNKIKIVDNYKPVDYSNLSNTSSSNIRNRNNSDNISQAASIRSRQVSQPNSTNIEEMNQYPDSDQMFEETYNNSTIKANTKYLNVEQQLQLAQKNQEDIQKQQLQKQIDNSKIDQNKVKESNEEKLANTLEKQARNISSNGSSVYDGDEEIDQFLTAEKNKNEGNIQISQRRAFDMYGYSDEDDYGINNQNIHQNNEIYIDQESENNDRLDVSPIFTVSSASKQGTQDKESLKYLMNNNQGEIAQNMKIESDSKYDKIKQFNKRNSQESRMSESQPSSPLSQSSKKNQDPYQTIEYDDEGNSKKQTVSNKVSPKLGFMRGDLLQEEGIEDKVNYVSDQTLNYLVDDAAKGKNIKNIKDKQQNEKDTNQQQGNMIQINFLEPIKARQNVYNLDDFPDVSEKTSSLETSSGIFKVFNPLTESSNIQDKKNQHQNKEEEQLQKQNNNNTSTKQKNLIPSPPNSPTQRENSVQNKNIGDKKPLQNNFLLDLVQNDQKQNTQEINQNLQNQNEREKQDKIAPEDLYLTQNSQQQLQFSENILTTQNNPPGLECATLNFIKDYLVAFSEFIKDNFTDEFLERVNIPLGMDPQEFLKTFTITETIDNSNGEISAAPIYPIVKYIHMQRPVVSEELFAHFNEIFNRERDLSLMTEELFELERFHMRMIFDCFNEALDSMRPFGLRGKPLPWKINSNKLSSIIITPDNIEKILGLAIAKVLKWGSFLCGFIPERIESPTGEIVQIEDEYLNQIKEDRLAQMLENEVIENEDKWLTYEDEETDVQLEIADDIFNYIIEETAMIVHSLQNGQAVNQIKNETSSDLNDNQNIERNFNNNSYETLSKNIFGNPNITKGAKKQGLGGGIRPTNDLGISQKQAQEKKQLQKELFLKNLQNSSLNNNQQSQKDQLNSSF